MENKTGVGAMTADQASGHDPQKPADQKPGDPKPTGPAPSETPSHPGGQTPTGTPGQTSGDK